MEEEDMMARLSRALDTQSVTLTDGGASTQQMIDMLAQQIDDLDVESKDESEWSEGESGFEYRIETRVELPNRPTPYEVWASKHDTTKSVKAPKVMRNNEWNGLVERLHGTKRSKESTIKQQQNRELAEQLRELKFKPSLNKNSARISKETQRGPMLQRMEHDRQVKEKKLEEKRAKQSREEVEEVLDKPNLLGAKLSLRYLKQANKPTDRTVEDIMQYGEETKLRRLQRKQIMEELENRELTFTPQLNRASLMLQEKMRREGRSMYNKVSGQTETRQKVVKGGSGTNEDPGHEEEVFAPRISSRAVARSCDVDKNVYSRLYDNAQESQITKHNEQVQLLSNFTKDMVLKKQETISWKGDGTAASWVLDRKASKKRESSIPLEAQVNVLEYSPALDFILEKLNSAQSAQA
mmetsp:Transcript_64984/g.89282  ORF Transcript_64984/g.89282 Transcript_64984/m.89282 type:complete len:410 (-) Transcript_64984:366-1595(-)